MITLKNIRVRQNDDFSYLVCDMKADFTDVRELWFSVPIRYEDWLTEDVFDAFLVEMLYPAMYYNEDIYIDGNVSPKLLFNIREYVQYAVKAYRPEFHIVSIKAKGTAVCNKKDKLCGTGFSAGVDSFSTFYDRYVLEKDESYKISALFFFNVGSHGGGGDIARKRFHVRYDYLKKFPREIGLPYIPVDSNMFDFYHYEWEYDAGIFCRASAILVFQKMLSNYYVSNTLSYSDLLDGIKEARRHDLASSMDCVLLPILSTEEVAIHVDGAQYLRVEKTSRIANYEPVRRYLNVCVKSTNDYVTAKNCGTCSKCLRTLFTLDVLGLLDKYADVFDIEAYKRDRYEYMCQLRINARKDNFAYENVKFAETHGVKFPSLFYVRIREAVRKPAKFTRLVKYIRFKLAVLYHLVRGDLHKF